MNVIMDGRQQQGNTTIQQNKTKTKQKQNHLHLWVDLMAIDPTLPIVTMGRVSIQSKII